MKREGGDAGVHRRAALITLGSYAGYASMGEFLRPPMTVLPESALVPDKNIISPPPNQFTHEVNEPQPFYFTDVQEGGPSNGQLEAGTKVVLLVHDGGDYCRVADGSGLYVQIKFSGLRKL
jgi:hypothetical protein